MVNDLPNVLINSSVTLFADDSPILTFLLGVTKQLLDRLRSPLERCQWMFLKGQFWGLYLFIVVTDLPNVLLNSSVTLSADDSPILTFLLGVTKQLLDRLHSPLERCQWMFLKGQFWGLYLFIVVTDLPNVLLNSSVTLFADDSPTLFFRISYKYWITDHAK